MRDIQPLAAGLVGDVLAGQSLAQRLPEIWRRYPDLSPSSRGALQDMVYGSLRHLGRIDAFLRELASRPIQEPALHCLLRVAVYQLLYTRAAPHAIVNEAVAAIETMGFGWAKGFVNGVLRNAIRKKDEILPKLTTEVATYSFPRWWINRLKKDYPQHWRTILEASNTHPPFTLRVNLRNESQAGYLERLTAAGMSARPVGAAGVRLDEPVPVAALPGFAAGDVSVQDSGAQLAAELLDVQPGMRVLDACSAPGGKTAHILERVDCELLALDRDAARLGRVQDNLDRLGLQAQLQPADAERLQTWWDGRPFERILADVPCTASGVVRRHPDSKWLRLPEDVQSFAATQQRILDSLWQSLASGGKLLYVTCSIFPEENQQQIDRFLTRHADARRLPVPVGESGQLLPDNEHDGFFYALLQKHAG